MGSPPGYEEDQEMTRSSKERNTPMREMIDNAVIAATHDGLKAFWFSDSGDVETLWNEFNETRVLPWANVLLMVDEPLLGGGSISQPNYWLTPWDWAMAMS